MSLIQDIKTISQNLYPDATYRLLSEFNTNEDIFFLESSELPIIVLNNKIIKNAEIKQNNNVIKDTRIQMYILKQDLDDYTDDQSEELRAACEVIADRIAVNIYQLLPVRPTGNQRYTVDPEFNAFASDLTGVTLNMNINYNEVVNFKTA